MNSILVEFFRHHTWANLRVVDACASLTPEQLSMAAPGTYGSIRDTLLHLVDAEAGYLATLSDTAQPPRRQPDAPFPEFAALRGQARAQGERLTAISVHAHIDDEVQVERRGTPCQVSVAIVLLAALNHGTEHRQEILATFPHLGVEPPRVGAFAFAEREA